MSSPPMTFGHHAVAAISELEKETDRGAFVISAAWIDDLLAEAIANRLLPSPKQDDALLGRGQLSQFGTRIELAYRLGIIGDDLREVLALLQKIRNDCAHKHGAVDFDAPPIEGRVKSLVQALKNAEMWDDVARGMPTPPPGRAQRMQDARVALVFLATIVAAAREMTKPVDRKPGISIAKIRGAKA